MQARHSLKEWVRDELHGPLHRHIKLVNGHFLVFLMGNLVVSNLLNTSEAGDIIVQDIFNKSSNEILIAA